MPGLKTTLTMDGTQYDAALSKAVATSAASSKAIQRNLSQKIEWMEGRANFMPMGPDRSQLEQRIIKAKMLLRMEVEAQAQADLEKVASNRAAMDLIVMRERQAGIAFAAEQRAEVAARAAAEAEKVAIQQAALFKIIAQRRAAEMAEWQASVAAAGRGQAAITAIQISQNEKRLALERLTAAGMIKARAASRVGAAWAAIEGAGGKGFASGEMRDELAHALVAQRAFRDIGAAAGAASGPVKGLSLVMRETLVIFREIGRGNWARVPGSFTMVLQGLATMGALTWGLIAGGVLAGLGLLAWHLHTVATRAKNLIDLLDPLKKKFTEQADALRGLAKEHQGYLDWLKKAGQDTDSLPEKIDKVIRKMREQAAAERELAQAKGKSHMDIYRMTQQELASEYDVLAMAKRKAIEEQEAADEEASGAQQEREHFDTSSVVGAKTAATNAGAILDAVQKKMESSSVTVGTGRQFPGPFGNTAETLTRTANESDKFNVKVGDKTVTTSVADAKAAYNKATGLADQLEAKETELKDAVANSRTTREEKNKAVKQITSEIDEIKNQLGLSGTRQQIARLQDAKRRGGSRGGSMNAEQRVGAYYAGDEKKANHLLERIAHNTEHLNQIGRASCRERV